MAAQQEELYISWLTILQINSLVKKIYYYGHIIYIWEDTNIQINGYTQYTPGFLFVCHVHTFAN